MCTSLTLTAADGTHLLAERWIFQTLIRGSRPFLKLARTGGHEENRKLRGTGRWFRLRPSFKRLLAVWRWSEQCWSELCRTVLPPRQLLRRPASWDDQSHPAGLHSLGLKSVPDALLK